MQLQKLGDQRRSVIVGGGPRLGERRSCFGGRVDAEQSLDLRKITLSLDRLASSRKRLSAKAFGGPYGQYSSANGRTPTRSQQAYILAAGDRRETARRTLQLRQVKMVSATDVDDVKIRQKYKWRRTHQVEVHHQATKNPRLPSPSYNLLSHRSITFQTNIFHNVSSRPQDCHGWRDGYRW